MKINAIDLLLISIILFSIGFGWYRGFILGLFDLARWAGSVVLAFLLYAPLSRLIGALTDWSEMWNHPAAFVLIVIFSSLIVKFLGSLLIRKLPDEIHKKSLNQILGILPGLVSGTVLTTIIAALLFTLPIAGNFQDSLSESDLAEPLAIYSDQLETALAPIFEDAVNETLTRRLTSHPGSNETVELPFKVTEYKQRPDLEAEMLTLVNKERAAEGLAPLKADSEMREVAEKHSADMFERGYFAHNTPEDKTPFDRMQDADVKFRTAGENLAFAPSLKIAHTGLMNSPGHRANILRPQYGRVGISILDGGRRGLMITQNFRN